MAIFHGQNATAEIARLALLVITPNNYNQLTMVIRGGRFRRNSFCEVGTASSYQFFDNFVEYVDILSLCEILRLGPYFCNSDSKTAIKTLSASSLALSSSFFDSKAASKILIASILAISPLLNIFSIWRKIEYRGEG